MNLYEADFDNNPNGVREVVEHVNYLEDCNEMLQYFSNKLEQYTSGQCEDDPFNACHAKGVSGNVIITVLAQLLKDGIMDLVIDDKDRERATEEIVKFLKDNR